MRNRLFVVFAISFLVRLAVAIRLPELSSFEADFAWRLQNMVGEVSVIAVRVIFVVAGSLGGVVLVLFVKIFAPKKGSLAFWSGLVYAIVPLSVYFSILPRFSLSDYGFWNDRSIIANVNLLRGQNIEVGQVILGKIFFNKLQYAIYGISFLLKQLDPRNLVEYYTATGSILGILGAYFYIRNKEKYGVFVIVPIVMIAYFLTQTKNIFVKAVVLVILVFNCIVVLDYSVKKGYFVENGFWGDTREVAIFVKGLSDESVWMSDEKDANPGAKIGFYNKLDYVDYAGWLDRIGNVDIGAFDERVGKKEYDYYLLTDVEVDEISREQLIICGKHETLESYWLYSECELNNESQ